MALMMLRMQSSPSSPNFYKFPSPDPNHEGSNFSSSLPLRLLQKIMSEPTMVDYGDSATKKTTPHWLSPNYIDLHLRSARLVSCEAKIALHRHFERPREMSLKKPGNGQQETHERSMPIVWDPSREPPLTMAYVNMDGDRSFLDEAFC